MACHFNWPKLWVILAYLYPLLEEEGGEEGDGQLGTRPNWVLKIFELVERVNLTQLVQDAGSLMMTNFVVSGKSTIKELHLVYDTYPTTGTQSLSIHHNCSSTNLIFPKSF